MTDINNWGENAATNVIDLQPFIHYQCLKSTRKGLIKRKRKKEPTVEQWCVN